ncbi:glycosyltransferase family 1 protein [Pseudoxanthomonas sp. SGD-10]|nr:glycosyltransferase family 1 protein [Pseudoxanthomonas sp. SGD-10]
MENARKKVLIACDSYRSLLGFRGKLMEDLSKSCDVAVFTPTIKQDQIRQTLDRMGITIYENNLDGSNVSIFSDLVYISALFKVIRNAKPDVFFPYTFKPVIYGAMVARACRVKRIVPMLTGLGYNFMNDKNNLIVKNITRILLKASLNTGENLRLILQNRDDYQTLLNARVINKGTQAFVVNGSGVDLSYYNYTDAENQSPVFLMIARLINAKGIREYYEAANLLLKDHPHAKFKLIGPRDYNIDAIPEDLYNQIISNRIVEYLGEVNDVRPYIKSASVVVLPSYYGEGVPRCLLEAMAMGRAIITCDSVGCKETVDISDNHRSGFLVPVKNVNVLAEKMRHFIEHPQDAIVFGRNGREYAMDKFDVNKVNAQMLKILHVH